VVTSIALKCDKVLTPKPSLRGKTVPSLRGKSAPSLRGPKGRSNLNILRGFRTPWGRGAASEGMELLAGFLGFLDFPDGFIADIIDFSDEYQILVDDFLAERFAFFQQLLHPVAIAFQAG